MNLRITNGKSASLQLSGSGLWGIPADPARAAKAPTCFDLGVFVSPENRFEPLRHHPLVSIRSQAHSAVYRQP